MNRDWHYISKGEFPDSYGLYRANLFPLISCYINEGRGRDSIRVFNTKMRFWVDKDGIYEADADTYDKWAYVDDLSHEKFDNMTEEELEWV